MIQEEFLLKDGYIYLTDDIVLDLESYKDQRCYRTPVHTHKHCV